MAKKDRLEKIRKVRSLNDILDILKDITKETTEDGKVAQRLYTSLSATRKDEVIKIQHVGQVGKPRKISTKRLQGGDFSVQLKDFKAPAPSAIQKHVSVVQRLYDNAKELDSVEAMLNSSFSGVKSQNTALKGVQALRAEVDHSIQTALAGLNKIAQKHFPTEMEHLRDGLTSYLLDNIAENQYEDMGFLEYASLGEGGTVVFSVYVEIKNLKNDAGYVFDEYFMILTGVVNAKGYITYYINALPDFRVPGKYPLGKEIGNSREMELQANLLLSHNNVITDMDRKPIPLSQADAERKGFKAIKGVTGVEIKDDSMYIQIANTDPRTINSVVSTTMALLNQSIGRKKDTSISWKQVTRGSKKYIKFILYFRPDKQGGLNLNVAKLKEIQSIFDLDDKQTTALRQSLLD